MKDSFVEEIEAMVEAAEALTERGQILLRFGCEEEAEAAFREVMERYPFAAARAVKQLMWMRIAGERFDDAVRLGSSWRDRVHERALVERELAVALSFSGRYGHALRLLRERGLEPLEAYQAACCASRLGEFHAAWRYLHFEFQTNPGRRLDALADVDLRKLWRVLRVEPLSLPQAHSLCEATFDGLAEVAAQRPVPDHFDWCGLRELPAECRALFRYDHERASLVLDEGAARRQPELAARAQAIREAWWREAADNLRIARERAWKIVVEAQVPYALDQVEAGNFTAARHHLLWALAHEPAMVARFLEASPAGAFRELARSLEEPLSGEPGFVARLWSAPLDCREDVAAAADALAQTPDHLRSHPVHLLRRAMIAELSGEIRDALDDYAAVSRAWPEDVAPWAYAINCQARLGEWKRATALLEKAPPILARFTAYDSLVRLCRDHSGGLAHGASSFRGEPNLGGILKSAEPAACAEEAITL